MCLISPDLPLVYYNYCFWYLIQLEKIVKLNIV